MKSVKVSEVLQNIQSYPFVYLKNFSSPSVKYSYKPICLIPNGVDKGCLLLARWSNCAQKVLLPEDTVFIQ